MEVYWGLLSSYLLRVRAELTTLETPLGAGSGNHVRALDLQSEKNDGKHPQFSRHFFPVIFSPPYLSDALRKVQYDWFAVTKVGLETTNTPPSLDWTIKIKMVSETAITRSATEIVFF